MKTYILEGIFQEGRPTGPAFQAHLKAHHQYLSQGFADGSILFSGPVTNREDCGGVIVVKSDDIEAFCREDPFVKNGVQTYRVLEFKLFDGQEGAKAWAGQ